MPVSQPPLPIEPALLETGEAEFIKDTVRRFYGPGAVVRTYGPDLTNLKLHVETDEEPGMKQYDCAGVIYARLNRQQIGLEVTKRGTKPRAEAKIAYRQGVVL